MDHLIPRARGGSNHGNNIRVACVPCNFEKGTLSARTIRARYGYSRSPLSLREVRTKRLKKTAIAGIIGGVLSGLMTKSWKIGAGVGLLGGVVVYGFEIENEIQIQVNLID